MTSPATGLPLTYTKEELLSSGSYESPLIAGGVRCHGGFEADGQYRSPRTIHRGPAIRAWQDQLTAAGHEIIDIQNVSKSGNRNGPKGP